MTRLHVNLWRVLPVVVLLVFISSTLVAAGVESKIIDNIGSQIARMMEEEIGVVDDAILLPWVVDLGNRLVAVSGRPDAEYRFKILDSEEINAVAVPGGYIYVTKGLLRFIESEDELAGVLGHEIAHIAARHSNKQIRAQVLGSLILSTFKSRTTERIAGGAQLAGLFALLKYSRDHEHEADKLGLKASSTLGYDGRHTIEFFNRMDARQKYKPSRFESYFLTHPTTKDRLQRISDHPALEDNADNAFRRAENLRDRYLSAQAEAEFRKAFAQNPELLQMKESFAQRSVVEWKVSQPAARGEFVPKKEFDAAYANSLQALESKIEDLGKQQSRLEKQIRGIFSNLQFASRFVSPYDVVRIREFMAVAEAAERVHRIAANIEITRSSAAEILEDFSILRERLAAQDAPSDIAVRFQSDSIAAMAAIGEALNQAAEVGTRLNRTARTVDFAGRQLISSLMMPPSTALGMSGMIELQLAGVKKPLRNALRDSREVASLVERQRTVALETRIDLQMTPTDERRAVTCKSLIARYFGVPVEDVGAVIERIGRFGGAAYAVAKRKIEAAGENLESGNSESEGERAQSRQVDYGGINIMLELILRDIERERSAAAG